MALDRTLGVLLLAGAAGAAALMALRSKGVQISLPQILPAPAGAPAAGGGQVATTVPRPTSGPRGIRNHNPGNITKGALPWNGQAGNDGRYVIFKAPLYGLRAIYRLLANYNGLYGIRTIQQIANRWAPAPENNPANYAANVSRASGIPAGQPLNFNDFETMTRVAKGIVIAENGVQPYPDALFAQAWQIRG